FSDHTQAFGTSDNGTFVKSFDVNGVLYAVTGSGTVDLTHGITAVGRSGDSSTNSSIVGDNPDGRDHVVTYKITGDGPILEYMLFWEDLDLPPGPIHASPNDFNDLGITLRAAHTGRVAPLPPAALTGTAPIASLP